MKLLKKNSAKKNLFLNFLFDEDIKKSAPYKFKNKVDNIAIVETKLEAFICATSKTTIINYNGI